MLKKKKHHCGVVWCGYTNRVHNACIFLVFWLQAFDGREGGVMNDSIGKMNFVEIGCHYAINQSKYITVLLLHDYHMTVM